MRAARLLAACALACSLALAGIGAASVSLAAAQAPSPSPTLAPEEQERSLVGVLAGLAVITLAAVAAHRMRRFRRPPGL